MTRNRILIADQSAVTRQTLLDLLQEDSEIVATVDNADAIVDALRAVNPSLVVLGVDFQGTTGFQIVERLRQSKCRAKIIIVSLYESKDLARAALAAGASAYVFVSRLLDDLPAAIKAAREGQIFEPKA